MNSPIKDKSFQFGVRIVRFCRWLRKKSHDYELASQLLRSGTSIGANVAEAQNGQTRKEFISKMYIAFKETNETIYWLELLKEAEVISQSDAGELLSDANELRKILASIIKTAKQKCTSPSKKQTKPSTG